MFIFSSSCFRIPSYLTSYKVPSHINILMDDPNDTNMMKLRTEYMLEGIVTESDNDYEKLRKIVKWAHDQWKHSGSNKPSQSDPLTILSEANIGRSFRCVEYAIVLAASVRALGMPSRILNLKSKDAETSHSNAGHVIAEVWLNQFNKWVFADAQFDAIPEIDGEPLNAIEFQTAITRSNPKLLIRTLSGIDSQYYTNWINSYLYYFDFSIDQRFFRKNYKKILGKKVMFVPKGAKKLRVFQKNNPMINYAYTSDLEIFYPSIK